MALHIFIAPNFGCMFMIFLYLSYQSTLQLITCNSSLRLLTDYFHISCSIDSLKMQDQILLHNHSIFTSTLLTLLQRFIVHHNIANLSILLAHHLHEYMKLFAKQS